MVFLNVQNEVVDIALRKLCQCGKIIDYNMKRCNQCEEKFKQQKKESDRYYDKNVRRKRDKKYYNFYRSKEWEVLRKNVLSHYNHIDIYQLYINNKIVVANTVHHIIEVREDWNKRLDFDNMFPCSSETHSSDIDRLYNRDKEEAKKVLLRLLEKYKKDYM